MLLVHLLGWAAVGVLAIPVAPTPPPLDASGSDGNGQYYTLHPHGNIPGALPLPLPPTATAMAGSGDRELDASKPPPTATTESPHDSECTETVSLFAFSGGHILRGPVKTVWASTVFTTMHYDCHGCKYLATEKYGGHGPVVHFTTTVTESVVPQTMTKYACNKESLAMATAVRPTTQSPSPPPALPTPKN